MTQRTYTFSAGEAGEWHIERITTISGDGLAAATRLAISNAPTPPPEGAWSLTGVVSNERYVTRVEKAGLLALPMPAAPSCAALIPLRKSPAWWAMTQDERRAIFEEQSHHIAIGVELGSGISRRLHHCRDLPAEASPPFDFLTWFEYAPEDEARFDALLAQLRASTEWTYVEREVDIRLRREN